MPIRKKKPASLQPRHNVAVPQTPLPAKKLAIFDSNGQDILGFTRGGVAQLAEQGIHKP
jgi:hypothetical protein